MSAPLTNYIGGKAQASGENLNTWGVSPNLNDTLQAIANGICRWNPLTINVGATTTISETNYSLTNDTEVAAIKLVAGTVAAAFALVIPGRSKMIPVWNTTGYTATIKLAATTGFALPTGRIAIVGTDGSTDVYNMTPNYGGTPTPTSGSLDIGAWSAVETAIANAALPATAGTIRNSATDTTSNYIATKLTFSGSLVATTSNPGGNETRDVTFTFDEGQSALYAGVMAL